MESLKRSGVAFDVLPKSTFSSAKCLQEALARRGVERRATFSPLTTSSTPTTSTPKNASPEKQGEKQTPTSPPLCRLLVTGAEAQVCIFQTVLDLANLYADAIERGQLQLVYLKNLITSWRVGPVQGTVDDACEQASIIEQVATIRDAIRAETEGQIIDVISKLKCVNAVVTSDDLLKMRETDFAGHYSKDSLLVSNMIRLLHEFDRESTSIAGDVATASASGEECERKSCEHHSLTWDVEDISISENLLALEGDPANNVEAVSALIKNVLSKRESSARKERGGAVRCEAESDPLATVHFKVGTFRSEIAIGIDRERETVLLPTEALIFMAVRSAESFKFKVSPGPRQHPVSNLSLAQCDNLSRSI